MKYQGLLCCCAALVPAAAICDDAPPPPPPQGVWVGSGQVGYLSSQGNTDSKSANAMIDMSLLEDPWKHTLHVGALYGQSTGITSAERWDVLWQSNYNITQSLYTFGALRDEHDMFSGFQYQASAAAGLGYQIFNTDATKLSVQAGVGYQKARPEELIKDPDGAVTARIPEDTTGNAIGTLGVIYSQALTNTTTLSDKLLVESGSANTLVTNALALTVKMSTKLALSLGYGLQNNSSPPPGLKKLDSLETVNLVFGF